MLYELTLYIASIMAFHTELFFYIKLFKSNVSTTYVLGTCSNSKARRSDGKLAWGYNVTISLILPWYVDKILRLNLSDLSALYS